MTRKRHVGGRDEVWDRLVIMATFHGMKINLSPLSFLMPILQTVLQRYLFLVLEFVLI